MRDQKQVSRFACDNQEVCHVLSFDYCITAYIYVLLLSLQNAAPWPAGICCQEFLANLDQLGLNLSRLHVVAGSDQRVEALVKHKNLYCIQ